MITAMQKIGVLLLALVFPLGLLAAAPEPAATNATHQTAAPSGPPKLADFKIIQERNIFNPNRRTRAPTTERRPATRTVRSENLVLTGVMSYEKGTFAFFDGSNSSYRKVVKQGDSLADFKVASVSPQSVQLVSGTNTFKVPVGTQLRKEEGGGWRLSGRVEFASTTPAPVTQAPRPSTPTSTTSGGYPTGAFVPPEGYSSFEGLPPDFEMPIPPGVPFFNGEPPPEAAPQPGGETAPPQPPSPQPGGDLPENEVLRRLMERRAQEMN
jgi:hypothetical protein